MVDLPFFVLSIAIHLLFVSQNNIVTAKDDNNGVLSLIRKTCYNGTPFPDTCVTVPCSRADTDLISLSLSGMDIIYEDAKYITLRFVKAREDETDPLSKQKIDLCIKGFELGIWYMNHNGFLSFLNGDYEPAKWAVHWCNVGACKCSDSGTKLFNKETETLFNFSSDVMDFMDMLLSSSRNKNCM